ncbi:MAG: glutamyl-tRNA reductase [Candidatus Margulisbacteria bacterium]|nr:glutamyl-tRNA reductase [Candidatus Margulisiibacteriota bacterium]
MKFGLLSADYQHTSLANLEKIYLSKDHIAHLLETLKPSESIKEIVMLSTCNRVEIYFVSNTLEEAAREIKIAISNFRGLDPKELETIFSEHNDPHDVLNHLFDVVSGLKSMVFGETEILGQVKAAYDISHQHGFTGATFNKLFQTAIATGKRVRHETDISKGAYSISSIAIEGIKSHIKDFKDKHILIVGAGTMALRAIKKLAALGHTKLSISNRGEDKLNRISKKYGIHIIPYEQWVSQLNTVDIVIMATGSEQYLLDKTAKTPEMVVDLGVPRNVNPNVSENTGTQLLSLYNLQEIADKTIHKRKKALDKIAIILDEEKAKLCKWHEYKENACQKQSA